MENDFLYQAFYCEENAWQLCAHPRFKSVEKRVVFITNPQRLCPVWHMKTAPADLEPVLWDYHCIFLVRALAWQVWDHDSNLGWPVAASDYFLRSFRSDIHPEYQAFFRIVEADRYQAEFSSDRAHMRQEDGRWKHPPPPWATIGENRKTNLSDYLDLSQTNLGPVKNLAEIQALFI